MNIESIKLNLTSTAKTLNHPEIIPIIIGTGQDVQIDLRTQTRNTKLETRNKNNP